MDVHIVPEFTLANAAAAVMIGILYILLSSLAKEPARQRLSAIILAGAGGAYLSSGLGAWEFLFASIMLVVAYKGMRSYMFIGIGWLLHTMWDLLHHLYADPIVPFSPSSSAGCALCDAVLALWFFFGAPDLLKRVRRNAPAGN